MFIFGYHVLSLRRMIKYEFVNNVSAKNVRLFVSIAWMLKSVGLLPLEERPDLRFHRMVRPEVLEGEVSQSRSLVVPDFLDLLHVHSRRYRSRYLQPNICLAALFEIYNICTRLHRSKLKCWTSRKNNKCRWISATYCKIPEYPSKFGASKQSFANSWKSS